MHFTAVIIILAGLLSSCASVEKTHVGLNHLIGKDIRTAIYVLGYPTSKQEFAGDIVYVWSVDEYGQISLPSTSYITGSVGTTPVYGTVTRSTTKITHSICSIKIITNAEGIIKGREIDGNYSGCSNYMHRLGEYADSSTTPRSSGNGFELRDKSILDEDAVISSNVKNIISNLNVSANVLFGVFNTRVVLIGEVLSDKQSEEILQKIINIKGVTKTLNELRSVNALSQHSRDLDKTIEQAIYHRVNKLIGADASNYNIIIFNGEVYLLGIVKRDVGMNIAETASRTHGVKKVITVFQYTE